jgi:UDP-glucose:(heptosyl)LPS alpha-1,3-glucosyltransferase
VRIAYVIHDCNREGGQERYIAELAERLGERHDVHLYARTCRGVDCERVHLHPVSVPDRPIIVKSAAFFVRASAMVRREAFDIVHTIGACAGGQNIVTAQFVEAAWYERWRSLTDRGWGLLRTGYHRINSRFNMLCERRVYGAKGLRAVIAVSRSVREELTHYYGLNGTRIPVIYNGVDPAVFHPERRAEWRLQVRKEFGISLEAPTLLFVGAFERKGLRYVIEAMPMIPDSGVRLLVVGRGMGSGWSAIAAGAGVADRVVFAGHHADTERFFAAADLFVMPTLYEPFGMVIAEAMASGLPVVTSRLAGAAELIDHKVDGLLLDEPTNPAAIAREITPLLRESGRAQEMGCLARRKIEHYSWDYVVRETEAVYARVLVGGGTRA